METLLWFVVWAGLFFLMMRFGCGSHIMGHGHAQHGAHGKATSRDQDRLRWVPPEKDVDPVCGMTVETKTAKSAVHEGAVYYFCSTDCRDRFEKAPQLYLGAKAIPEPRPMEHSHG